MGSGSMPRDPGGSPDHGPEIITVVLADDADDVRLMLRLSLQREGDIAVVAEAADGAEAVELAAAHQPAAVVLDLSMPGGGIDAVAAVHRAAPGARIIVVSGQDRSSKWEEASAAGAAAYVQKGGRPSDIAALLRSLVRG